MSPTPQQLLAISITERVCSAVSLLGAFVIVTTFMSSWSFRKPINRLVFYASWGNIMANLATLISQSGIHSGVDNPLCQFQAFLIQWFMPADALWTFAMACNVYLTFFHKYNSDQLRQLEWKYLAGCYGIPFIPAFVYFFISTSSLGRVYGSAVLWCWVSRPWDFLRIATFYGPVWMVIFVTFTIYLRAGSVIYQKRRQLEALENADCSDAQPATDSPPISSSLCGIQVTHEVALFEPERPCSALSNHPSSAASSIHGLDSPVFTPYSVSVESGTVDPIIMYLNSMPEQTPHYGPGSRSRQNSTVSHSDASIALKNARCTGADSSPTRRTATADIGSAAWIYTKYAMLFFIALLVTWVPSTANRVYSLARPDDFSFALNYASSFVLPLQGFWNSLIYVSISWPAFKALWTKLRVSLSGLKRDVS
ncbi:hypothetical protein N7539_000684 [Penicillium diatomitis]|uniref:G-protein coupled receptors family 2 profile 2 domain-containing protein n=1 Tax=Penicillium diatomitis TaxID=2819901 RepID=A0A9W9XMD4_9EURO|nr:uncharacterized protein N7539_000684 [Penicillium diatomitis]KAJ5495568.1 hypothetical protein N7539_000684 [Penicillium diatomitis]